MQMVNWNHGNAVVNRYVVWNAMIIVAVAFFRTLQLAPWKFYLLSGVIILSQAFVVFSQFDFNRIYHHAGTFNELSKWVMKNYPNLYNPDPLVFLGRHDRGMLSTTDSVLIFTDDKQRITKMMIKKGSISQLIQRGVDSVAVVNLGKQLNYYHDYAYVNQGKLKEIGYVQENDSLIAYIEFYSVPKQVHFDNIRTIILGNEEWLNKIKKQALETNMSLDSAIQLNVNYVYQKQENEINR